MLLRELGLGWTNLMLMLDGGNDDDGAGDGNCDDGGTCDFEYHGDVAAVGLMTT